MSEKTPLILLVEDDENHAILISDAFDDSPYPVSLAHATTLAEARELLASSRPDLVITDLRLPDGDGTELLVSDPREQAFPIVVMTAYDDPSIEVTAATLGAAKCVAKSARTLADLPRIAERVMREWDRNELRSRAERAGHTGNPPAGTLGRQP